MQTNELVSMLNGYFKWNKARMKCFAGMLLALIKVRTVTLVELACGMDGKARMESRYKRIKRFFSQMTIKFSCLAGWVIHLFNLVDKAVYLSLDRTN